MDRDRAARTGFVGVHFLRDGMASRALVVTLMAACGGDNVCPAAIVGDGVWLPLTDSAECAELAAALNDAELGEGLDLGEDLREQGGQCVASYRADVDGVAVELECEASASGAADCEAHVQTEGLECNLLLRVR